MIDLKPLDSLYDNMYKDVSDYLLARNYTEKDIENLSPFKSQIGGEYPSEAHKGMVFYGRATNGWDEDNHETLKEILTGQRYRPFINLIYWVGWTYYGDSYYDKIVWSNICKIAPDGGNPSGTLWDAQYPHMVKIIKKEIEILSPAVVVLVTGNAASEHWDAPFFEAFPNLHEIESITWGLEKECKATLYSDGNLNVIVTDRPESRPIEEHANAITSLIEGKQLDKQL